VCKSITAQHFLVSVSTHHVERFPRGFIWYFLTPKKALSFHGRNERRIAKPERKWAAENETMNTVVLAGITGFGVGKKK